MRNRTYSHKGEKTTLVATKNVSKTSHSYTAQYTITLDGSLIGKVFLCMQEINEKFGPRVQETVNSLAEEFKNVVVTCSKSGKLSTPIYQDYLRKIVAPYVGENGFMLMVDSWTGQTNLEMYDEIFVDSESLPTCTVKVIPGKCTSMCQPLDVYFYRQVKIFIKTMQNNVILIDEKREINTRS